MTNATNSSLSCTVSNNTATMNKGNKGQKVTFTFNPKQAFDLKSGASIDSFIVKQTIASIDS